MTGDPRIVSIIVTTRDRPSLVPHAVASALEQTYSPVEVIVVDDGSVEPYSDGSGDTRVEVVRLSPGRGVCAARNRGVEAADGDWVVFLDDDDRLAPDMVESSLQSVASSPLPPPVAVLSAIQRVDDARRPGKLLHPPTLARGADHFLEEGVAGSFLTHNSLFVPTTVVRAIGGWDEDLTTSEHDDFFLRLNAVCSLQGNDTVGYYLASSSLPRLHQATLQRAAAMEQTVRKHPAPFGRHRRRGAHYMATVGVTYLRGGRWGSALVWTSRAVARDPLRGRHLAWWLASLIGPVPLRWWRALRHRRS